MAKAITQAHGLLPDFEIGEVSRHVVWRKSTSHNWYRGGLGEIFTRQTFIGAWSYDKLARYLVKALQHVLWIYKREAMKDIYSLLVA